MAKYFLFEKDGAVATITFNRPQKLNCLDDEVVLELESLVQQVREDREARVLIATGTGRAFSAGADVSAARAIKDPHERAKAAQRSAARFPRLIGRVVDLISHLDIVTIAAVNGFAIGGGWSIALAFDFCLAVEGAEFWVPEVDMGVPYRGTPAQILALRMGPWAAKEATILCRHYKAEELLAMRVINRVVKAAELMPAARELAAALAAKPPRAVAPSKRDINAIFYGERLY
jgi:enoyl-CoA hydratase/carnithine racemase